MSGILLMAASEAAEEDVQIPLRNWVEDDAAENLLSLAASMDLHQSRSDEHEKASRESIIRKVTVAYGLVELLIRCPANNVLLDDDAKIGIDNFSVCVRKKVDTSSSQQQSSSWDDIRGVCMLSSGLSLTIEEPSYLSSFLEEGGGGGKDERMGRYLEVELDAANAQTDCRDSTAGRDLSKHRCHYLLAKILYKLFINSDEVFPDDSNVNYHGDELPHQQGKKRQLLDCEGGIPDLSSTTAVGQMQQMEVPASICRVVQNLFESASESGGDAYKTLEELGKDLQLLLFDPDRFLFDHEAHSTHNMQLRYRKEKLYGRYKEEALIIDSFYRVTRGSRNEAFFIGGFSGSGKSMLVDTLRVNVTNLGGYVIKHKFDAMSQDRPLFGVISALNQLCLMIKTRLSPQSLAALSEKLKDDFRDDIGLLARMMPNICFLSTEFSGLSVGAEDWNAIDKMNPRSVSFTLLRFVRLVSSPKNPIMLYLDDLQWADDTALDMIRTFLSDTMGSCMFFVGTYRDNEIQVGHAVFDLMENLEISNVPTNKVSLTGLDQEDLNTMISDALCLYPRICKSLSDVVFQKTKGSPFFVLEFMQSLQFRGLLQYDTCQKRWMWNEDAIRAEDITGNVLHLLSSKMNKLPNDMQLLLKVMACFGISTKETVIGYLAESPEYSEVRSGLEGAIRNGFAEVYAGGCIKFVHDKVREAAYNLIPDRDKKQLHYNLGKTLYSICEGKDVGNTIFLIASQINHGKEFIENDDAMRIRVAKLNMKAGTLALDGCDHTMAYNYFLASLSLLPDDSWERYYDLSLRLNFLMARAANSSCRYNEAELTLQTIFKRARCLHDKLSAYFLQATIFLAQGLANEAYTTCSSILAQLGETVPDTFTVSMVGDIIQETLSMYSEVYSDDWLERKMEDTNLRSINKFYFILTATALFCKQSFAHAGSYFACKLVQISLRNGICEHTPLAVMRLSLIAFNNAKDNTFSNAALGRRIANDAILLSDKFGSSDKGAELCLNYYLGAGSLESYVSGSNQLRNGFASGLSSGDAHAAFFCAAYGIHYSVISGGKDLNSLLKEIDYYLHLLKTYKSELAMKVIMFYRETVSTLIDRGERNGIEANLSNGNDTQPCRKLLEMFYFHAVFKNFWLGYTERCNHFAEKSFAFSKHPGAFTFHFYYGLNLLDMRKKKANLHQIKVVEGIIASMKVATSHAHTNFKNKLELLEAERYGLTAHHDSAVALRAYEAAITSARKAGFIHEQGLACEKAGFYSKRVKDNERSLTYFNQALECYKKWGSSMKADFIRKELRNLGCDDDILSVWKPVRPRAA